MTLVVVLNPGGFLPGFENLGTVELSADSIELTTHSDPKQPPLITAMTMARAIRLFIVNGGDSDELNRQLTAWEDDATLFGLPLEKLFFTPGLGSLAERTLIKLLQGLGPNSEHYRFYQQAGERIGWDLDGTGQRVRTLLQVVEEAELAPTR